MFCYIIKNITFFPETFNYLTHKNFFRGFICVAIFFDFRLFLIIGLSFFFARFSLREFSLREFSLREFSLREFSLREFSLREFSLWGFLCGGFLCGS